MTKVGIPAAVAALLLAAPAGAQLMEVHQTIHGMD